MPRFLLVQIDNKPKNKKDTERSWNDLKSDKRFFAVFC